MSMPKATPFRAFPILLLALAVPAGLPAQVGEVEFPNSGSRRAQGAFLHGLAQLHNFQYGEAAEAFRRAQEIDPDFAMAYWGEAMTHNHPVWQEQDSTAARAVLERLGRTREARAAKAGTDRERAYVAALEILYGPGPKEARDVGYSEAMRRVHEAYPDDPDAAAFYALSLLGTAHAGRDFATYMRAAAVVEDVFAEHPEHPGAAHYLIHSYDDPLHAPLGLRAAQAYAGIAPDAAHAQHMTSHIFVAMGMWEDVVEANENARRVVRTATEARGGTPRGCGHYNFWLEYGYLQLGRTDDARTLLRECFETARGAGPIGSGDILDPDNTTRGSYAAMLARYILDTEAWNDESLRWTLPLDDLFPARLTWTFVNGYAAAKRGELVTTEVSREAIAQTRRELEEYLAGDPSGGDANLGDAYLARARILETELEALIADARGDTERALALVSEAAELEEGLPLFFGPPMVDKPAGELLGELLLEARRADEAVEAFRAQLERTPERMAAVRGLERATAELERRPDPAADERAVLDVVVAFFDAMAAGDGEAWEDTLLEDVTFVGTTQTTDGVAVNGIARDEFLALLEGPTGFLERMWDPAVRVHGTIATVWTPYDLHRDGEFSHCGIDAFSLVKTNEGWRIASIVWTAEPVGCDPSPLGPP